MFTNKDGCTIYEKTIQNRAPTYIRHTTGAVYWEETAAQQQSNTARSETCSVLCCIPAASLTYLPKKDDRIVCGICAEEQPPKTAHTVMRVKDLRYGSHAVQHVEVGAV